MSSENSIIEKTNLLDLEEINKEAEKYEIDLILIEGNSVRAYTESRSWRFTKDLDFITTSTKLGLLYGVLNNLGYNTMKTDYGIKGRKKLMKNIQSNFTYPWTKLLIGVRVRPIFCQKTSLRYPSPFL